MIRSRSARGVWFVDCNKATPRSNNASPEALEEKTKAELAKLQSDTAAPSSFVEEGAPDSFADLDAKLKVRGSGAQMEIVRSRRACEVCLSTIARRRKIASRFLQKTK